ncbi:FmdB family transcriptional regulator [Pseudoclavibacter sp. RFBJ3]|uniref:FmdB family zinc ribbon protein n=1 Tax=unclassified Pseudoclavibacter TaxID=2615177 RepID=UPI000CE897A1|nr:MULTISPECIES: FmdB family zinc ribbon protein [unclassified Pseudoclavibacter]PPF83767.1 FmdB family transcriptional regulator [Pseudoclavibacter sp. RFBJ5]PPF92047.1 FmdB family transcriptional regulator [Pseudoclavibacter sp. RFBJ3]PPF96910.1 FmdB family transcriptional regulator [Pseudoclavibacter sp. RFBH5]PPG23597.1 FmdB family transcriptional regulator [Pseudoclavibacter sp. RFBI4]
MPTYSYRCTECDNAFDIQQGFADASLTVCDKCGGKLRKVFGAVGVSFKGSGFYRTDSAASAKKSSSSSSASTSAEAKPAATKKEPAPAAASSSSSSPAAS